MDLSPFTERVLEIRQPASIPAPARNRRPWTREEIVQGFAVDTGDLPKLRAR